MNDNRNYVNFHRPGDLVAYIAGGLVAITTICTTDVIAHPLQSAAGAAGPTQPRLLQLSAAASVGHFAYRLVLKFVTPSDHEWTWFDVIGYVIGVMAAVTVECTSSLRILAVTGLIYQASFAI